MSVLSTALAGIGTLLTALAVLAPSRRDVEASAAVSLAPPREPPPVERWNPPPRDTEPLVFDPPARWPAMADRRAEGCAVAVRLALIDGLQTLGTPWADAILRCAHEEDPDPVVRSAARAALREGC